MPGPSLKTADNSVEEQCEKFVSQGAARQALELLMEAYGASIYAFCYSMLRDTSSAADVLQTTFVQAYSKLQGFEKKTSFHVWLFTIARNRAVDYLRAVRRREKISVRIDETLDMADASPLADQLIHKQQMLQALGQCLEELRSQTKDADVLTTFMLRFRENLSYEQISEILETSTATLRVRIARIVPRLKQCLESKGGGI